MEQISNSVIKEQFRQKNEETARREEGNLRSSLSTRRYELNRKKLSQPYFSVFIKIGIALAFLLYLPIAWYLKYGNWMHLGFKGLLPGFGIGIGAGIIIKSIIYMHNESIKNEIARLEQQCENDVRSAYQRADERTRAEIREYEDNVKKYAQQIGQKRAGLKPMIQWLEAEFDHQLAYWINKAANSERYVKCRYKMDVLCKGIRVYDQIYSVDQYDFDFYKERYRCLSKSAECEGLANVLAKIVEHDLNERYKNQHCDIKLSHMDATVFIDFRMPNKKFVTATVIV